ncbi:Ochratoxin highly reducing polyketide synthase [Lachnellula suecica]|uniref:Ochratoxin highly reducing polyketide synthase n=1 Tax=Lachnellula suecica TaxID=602035 RepID=A0A8T9C9J0_9HELO|nr:Ochratoxin highly reducing polyketide synthase [Lachnellula suecica]
MAAVKPRGGLPSETQKQYPTYDIDSPGNSTPINIGQEDSYGISAGNSGSSIGTPSLVTGSEAKADPVAIIGLSCRFAGDAKTPREFLEFILQGRSAAGPFPSDKLNAEGYYHPDPDHAGTFANKGGYFLSESADAFDAPFFNLSENDVAAMDPQQKLLLEDVYHALENAGLNLKDVMGSPTSVFVGCSNNDQLALANADLEMALKSKATGTSLALLANRISWFYNMTGTSQTIDTACSSSLVAFHQACQNIRSGESTMAVVSGVNLIEFPGAVLYLSNLGVLSPDGQCFSFDSRANGYGRGEGVSTVILKSLSAAIKDGDTIRAVVRASGSNQDGRTPGITMPNPVSQESLIREVYTKNNLDMNETTFVEAHGTGTQVGDPLEITAISSAFNSTARKDPLYVGSVKASIGHLEGGAGMAGLITATLLVESRMIPPVANLKTVNSQIPANANIEFSKKPTDRSKNAEVFRASVNSFGFGGTNAHVVVDDSERCLRDQTPASESQVDQPAKHLFLFSTHDQQGSKRVTQSLSAHLDSTSKLLQAPESQYLADLAFTLNEKRSSFDWNTYLVVGSLAELSRKLDSGVSEPIRRSTGTPPSIGFVFTGQGAQWPKMGGSLIVYPVFRRSIEEASAYLQELGCAWRLTDVLTDDSSEVDINSPDFSQAACTAIQIALVELLASWNILPSKVVGHSSGEIAAAYCAGKISREAAWRVAYFRGVVSMKVEKGGSMMAAAVTEDEAQIYIDNANQELKGNLKVGCYNSPKNLTITGKNSELQYLRELLVKDEKFARVLSVKVAYHSRYLVGVADEYRDLLKGSFEGDLFTLDHKVEMVSSVTGQEILPGQVEDPDYWIQNLVSPVQFTKAFANFAQTPSSKNATLAHVIEIGPHSALRSAIREIAATVPGAQGIEYSNVLTRNQNDIAPILETVGRLVCRGHVVNISATRQEQKPQMLTDLPPYPFDHSRVLRATTRVINNVRFPKFPRNEMFGNPVLDWNPSEPRWRHFIRTSEMCWLRDNNMNGSITFPGVGYLTMAIEAVLQHSEPTNSYEGIRMRNIAMTAGLVIPETKEGIETMLSMRPAGDWQRFSVTSYDPVREVWTEHCTGDIKLEVTPSFNEVNPSGDAVSSLGHDLDALAAIEERCKTVFDNGKIYRNFESAGMDFGPTLRNVKEINISNATNECMGLVSVPDVAACMPMGYTQPQLIHPTLMESMMHVLLLICSPEGVPASPMVTTSIKDIWLSTAIKSDLSSVYRSYGTADQKSLRTWETDMTVLEDDSRKPIIIMEGVELVALGSISEAASDENPYSYYHVEWQPDTDLLTTADALDHWSTLSVPESDTETPPHRNYQLACAIYVLEAMEALKSIDTSGLAPYFQKFIEWMEHESERLSENLVPFITHADVKDKLLHEVETHNARGELLVRIGENIVPILTGEKNCLEIMFGESQLMSRTYDKGLPGNIRALLIRYLEVVGRNKTNLKILEVGAGTGSATGTFLEALSPRDGSTKISSIAQYTFTDVSAGFLEKAKERFAQWSNIVQYKVLNIEVDPTAQKFELGTYDMIVATHVLHATTDLHKTLANVRSLLKPGGKLVMVENVKPDLMNSPLAFGLLPGWWQSIESFRQFNPLIEKHQWNKILEETGFDKSHLLFKDTEDEDAHEMCVSVSTAIVPDRPQTQEPILVIVASKAQAESIQVKDLLQVLKAKGSQSFEVVDVHHMEGKDLKNSICIVMLDLAPFDLSTLTDAEFVKVQSLLAGSKKLLWVSGDPIQSPKLAMSTGLLRTIRWERDLDEVNFITLGFTHPLPDSPLIASKILELYDHVFNGKVPIPRNSEFVYHPSGSFWNNRLIGAPNISLSTFTKLVPTTAMIPFGEAEAIKMNIKSPGRLKTLRFVDDPLHSVPLNPTEVEIKVKASGLSKVDVASIMDHMPEESPGSDASGIVTAVGSSVTDLKVGDSVMALKTIKGSGPFQTFFRTNASAVQKIPEGFSFVDAAAIPLAFCTALLSLVHIARLEPGETVLIHSAAGGVGQAAIQLSKLARAEIFATVSTAEKKELLMSQYGIPQDHIYSSRDSVFVEGIMSLTGRRGVDVILNCLKGEGFDRTWDCIAPYGRFVDIEKHERGNKLDMAAFAQNVSYTGVDLLGLAAHNPAKITRVFSEVTHLFQAGKIDPPGRLASKAVAYQFPSNASYVLVGGLGGLGRSLAKWMFSRGARNFILLSRSGATNPAAKEFIKELIRESCQVKDFACDVTNGDAVAKAIAECAKTMPPIKGCLQGAMVLKDSMFPNMSLEQFNAAVHPKVQGSINLANSLPPGLDFFIMLSSSASIIGNRGQANYVAANTFLDAFAANLVSRGIPACSINLGSVLNVGWVAENQEKLPIALSYGSISEPELLSILEYHMDPTRNPLGENVSSQTVAGIRSSTDFARANFPQPAYMDYPLFSQLCASADTTSGESETKVELPIRELLSSTTSLETATALVTKAIILKLSRIMSIKTDEIDPNRALTFYGVDSLVVVDFRSWMKKELEADIAISDMLSDIGIGDLSELIAKASELNSNF